jgi:hypothetical protein
MDFSSVARVLESLGRRLPALAPAVTDWQAAVQQQQQASDAAATVDWTKELTALLAHPATADRWEPLAVALYLATQILEDDWQQQAQAQAPTQQAQVYMEGPRVPTMHTSTEAGSHPNKRQSSYVFQALSLPQRLALCTWLHTAAMGHLEHREPRVRTLVAKAVAVYGRRTRCSSAAGTNDNANDASIAALVAPLATRLVQSIRDHIQTGRHAAEEAAEAKAAAAAAVAASDPSASTSASASTTTAVVSASSTGALDDTTGWRALETNWQTLAALVTARGPQYLTTATTDVPLWTQLLQDAQYSAVTHVNRHVRAASMAWMEQVLHAIGQDYATWGGVLLEDPTSSLRQCLAAVLKMGLGDNWSQVRMAASVLTRVLFVTVQTHQVVAPSADNNNNNNNNNQPPHPLADLFPSLLPRMCLNRFYLAQGVKLYSHESWRVVMQDQGMEKVVQYLPAVVRYYVKAADADNHVVREAACQAMAELAVRLTEVEAYGAALASHVPLLLQALLVCFYDESWPVRDEACLASALLAKSFPEQVKVELPTLWQRWSEQLTDQIWSVRQDAGVALADALEAFGQDVWPQMAALLTKLLPSARDQPAMSRAAMQAHQNDTQSHTDSTLYSCGSLAPKLSKKAGAGRIGCSSCGVDREKAPWEATDGCIYLIRELVLRTNPDPDDPTHSQEPPLAGLGLTDEDYFIPLLQQVVDVSGFGAEL